jgi:glutathione S-transferase
LCGLCFGIASERQGKPPRCKPYGGLRKGKRGFFYTLGSEMSKRTVSVEFDGLDATEKAAIEAALNRCRALARQIESKLRNRPERFVDKLLLADFCASVERAADVLKQKRRRLVHTRPAPAVKGSKVRSRQRHR